jgi:hypothetical protein
VLNDDFDAVAKAAARHAGESERLTGVIPAEPSSGFRVYLCAYAAAEGRRSWLVLDVSGQPITNRRIVRDAASIAALCEVAEDFAGGGDLDDLSAQLVALRLTERPQGIEDAEEAVRNLQRVIGAPPRVASVGHLDRVGLAARRLEQALGEGGSPFAEGMKVAMPAVEKLADDVESNYKHELT